MSRPTLQDIAAAAGVSAKTVSNVLRGRTNVGAATRQRVREIAAAAGYQVNRAGQQLVSGRSGRIAVVVPNLHQPYFAETAERLIVTLGDHGFTTTLRIALDAEAEVAAVLGRTTADADGVIVCPHHLTHEMLSGARLSRPVVQLGGGPTGLLDTVVMGEKRGFEAVTGHVLDSGRRRLALLYNAMGSGRPEGSRADGFYAAHRARGLEPDTDLMVYGSDWDRRVSGYEATIALLRSGRQFDAVVAVNDALAVGALGALAEHGRRVPEDTAVTGFDDTVEVGFTVPPLTSVSPDHEDMVASAVDMLIGRLEGDTSPPRVRRSGAHLIIRPSTATETPSDPRSH